MPLQLLETFNKFVAGSFQHMRWLCNCMQQLQVLHHDQLSLVYRYMIAAALDYAP